MNSEPQFPPTLLGGNECERLAPEAQGTISAAADLLPPGLPPCLETDVCPVDVCPFGSHGRLQIFSIFWGSAVRTLSLQEDTAWGCPPPVGWLQWDSSFTMWLMQKPAVQMQLMDSGSILGHKAVGWGRCGVLPLEGFGVSISLQGCPNKLLRTEACTAGIYCLTLQKAGGLRWRSQQDWLPLSPPSLACGHTFSPCPHMWPSLYVTRDVRGTSLVPLPFCKHWRSTVIASFNCNYHRKGFLCKYSTLGLQASTQEF